MANDLFFAVISPQWHHTREELSVFAAVPLLRWFQYGYCAWRFDEHGAPNHDLRGVDPRCGEPR